MFNRFLSREYGPDDVMLAAAKHVGVEGYILRIYVDYVLTWDKQIHTRFATAHEYAVDRLGRDGWNWDQVNLCPVAYAQIEKFLSEAKAQGLQHKERR